MKTKNVFLSVVILLMSISLSASVEHLYMDDVQNGDLFYYCSTVDSVIVHKPEGAGAPFWYHEGSGNFYTDSIVITHDLAGVWQWNVSTNFTVNFTSIAPTEPFASEEIYKCPETSLVILGQTEHQPDFTYLWTGGETTQSINLLTPGMVYLTVTGACGEISDTIEVINYPSPDPDLGPNILTCNGETVTLDPGDFIGYLWNNGSESDTLAVTTTATYHVTVTDDNGCTASDEVDVEFIINNGQEILMVTIDTINGNNRITWDTLGTTDVTNVIYREVSTNVYTQVGTAPYLDGTWTDLVNSTNQTWRYKISTIDSCGNESAQSFYHQTISTATVPLVPSGYRVEWTEYLIEGTKGGEKSVSNYYVFAVDGLGINWIPTEIASVSGSVTSYNLPAITDSMFVVGADLGGTKAEVIGLALSNLVNNPLLAVPSILAEDIKIYPNPSTGTIFLEQGQGTLYLYNSIGQLVFSRPLEDNTTQIDIATPGLYTIKIVEKETSISKKIIIQ